jgi:hypothetical protein
VTNIPSTLENYCLRLENEGIKKIEAEKSSPFQRDTLKGFRANPRGDEL